MRVLVPGRCQRPQAGGLLGRLARAADGQASTQSIAGVRRPEHAAAPVTAGQVPGPAGSTSQLDTALPPCAASGQLVRPCQASIAGRWSFSQSPSGNVREAQQSTQVTLRSGTGPVSTGRGPTSAPRAGPRQRFLPATAAPCQSSQHQRLSYRARPCLAREPARDACHTLPGPPSACAAREAAEAAARSRSNPGTDDHRSRGRSTRTVPCSRPPSGHPRRAPAGAAGSPSCHGRAGRAEAASPHPRQQGAATGHAHCAGHVTRRWHPGDHRC